MPFVFSQTATYRDARGFVAPTRVYILATDLAEATTFGGVIVPAITGLTRGALQRVIGPYTTPETAIAWGGTDQYQSVYDKCVMLFSTASGGRHQYEIPAPKSDLFLADSTTVDPGNGLVTAYSAAMLANGAAGRDGDLLVRFIGGQLRRRRKPRKLTLLKIGRAHV